MSLITVIEKVANSIWAGWCLDLDPREAVNGCQFLTGEAAIYHPGVLHFGPISFSWLPASVQLNLPRKQVYPVS